MNDGTVCHQPNSMSGSSFQEIDPITRVPTSLEIAVRRDNVHLTDHGHLPALIRPEQRTLQAAKPVGGHRLTLTHVRKPTADEAARWYASFLDRENETHPSISDEDKDYDSKGGGIPWPWRTEDDWECPLLGTCHPVSMAALTLKFAPMQNGPTVRNQLRRCTVLWR